MAAIGVDALPMIAIVSGCAGFIVALQSGAELRRFGALQLVIDILTIGFIRELGPLLTAIVVSSRSGSAFSAEIGTIVVTSEIDALRTMALDPIEIVVAPKFVASLIVVPCLTIMSSLSGIVAGAVFMFLSAKMPVATYARSVANTIVLSDVCAPGSSRASPLRRSSSRSDAWKASRCAGGRTPSGVRRRRRS